MCRSLRRSTKSSFQLAGMHKSFKIVMCILGGETNLRSGFFVDKGFQPFVNGRLSPTHIEVERLRHEVHHVVLADICKGEDWLSRDCRHAQVSEVGNIEPLVCLSGQKHDFPHVDVQKGPQFVKGLFSHRVLVNLNHFGQNTRVDNYDGPVIFVPSMDVERALLQHAESSLRKNWNSWKRFKPQKVLRYLLSNLRNLEEASLDEFKNLSVIKAGRNFNVFIGSQPFFERGNGFDFVGCDIVPSVEDLPIVVISLNIDAIPSRLLEAVANEWRHRHRVLALVEWVVWVRFTRFGHIFEVLELVEIFVEGKFFVKGRFYLIDDSFGVLQ